MITTLLLVATTLQSSPPDIPRLISNAVCHKQVVLLGELPSHGESLAFQAKAAVVKELVTRCRFNVLLFEAPQYDFIGFDDSAAQHHATATQLDNAIGRFWTNTELAPWRDWLLERANRGKLVIAGLDDQVSATSEYARSALPRLVAPECRVIVERHLFWRYDNEHPFDDAEQQKLRACVRAAHAGDESGQAMLRSFSNFIDRETGVPAMPRDQMMFENLLWQLGRAPNNAKVIVWTATVHAAKQQGPLREKPLGAFVVERWGEKAAAIGFTARGGQSRMAGGAVKEIAVAPQDALETTATANDSVAFLDAAALDRMGTKTARLFGSFAALPWRNFFDGVVAFKLERPPR